MTHSRSRRDGATGLVALWLCSSLTSHLLKKPKKPVHRLFMADLFFPFLSLLFLFPLSYSLSLSFPIARSKNAWIPMAPAFSWHTFPSPTFPFPSPSPFPSFPFSYPSFIKCPLPFSFSFLTSAQKSPPTDGSRSSWQTSVLELFISMAT